MTEDSESNTTPLDEEDPFEHGRVGYGTYARYTPLLLALGIILILAWAGWRQFRPDEDLPRAGVLIGQPAPAWSLTLLDGSTLHSENLRGEAVVLNFWASWCTPCETEMPELEKLSSSLQRDGVPATIVGAGVKRDNDDNARAMVERLGITYPVGRDTGGSNDVLGPVTQAFGVDTYPATVFIRPDGVVSAIVFGPLTEESARTYIDAALEMT